MSMAQSDKIEAGQPSGSQSIQRASALLQAVASRGLAGARLVELARHTGLERPTAHRILKSLIAERLLVQDGGRRYQLGPLIFEMGLSAGPQANIRQLCEPVLAGIAERSGDTVFLTVRSGFDSICVDRKEGGFPIKTLTLDIGTRRPLGVGAGGIALLMSLSDGEAERIITSNTPRLIYHGSLSVSALLEMVRRARRLGYALNDMQATPGAISIGLPIPNPSGSPIAAVSIGAIASRMTPERQAELVADLQRQVALIGRRQNESTKDERKEIL